MPGKIFAQQQILDGESLQFIALFRRKGPSNVAGLRASPLPPIFITSKNIEFCYELGLTTLEPVSTMGPIRAQATPRAPLWGRSRVWPRLYSGFMRPVPGLIKVFRVDITMNGTL
jgi:hypothetical protein